MITKRQGIVVWVKHPKYVKRLRRYGHMIYASRRQKYVLLYVNQEEIEGTMEQIKQLNFVRKVDFSYKPFVDTVYQKKSPIKEEKEYEIKSVY
ncbi:YlbG family protein [Piscibacillus sp. B03]|uniref:YlbG family protein n=1 Tax=Piscibacillus sp. B03 TaxID=3457430 RepID=UPI003FCDB32D